MDYHVIDMTPQQFMGGGPRKRYPKNVFIAYRMTDARSMEFRKNLESRLTVRTGSEFIRLVDGKVATGVYWAGEIKDRIRQAKLVMADLTGPSKEVLFECGFAYGLRTPILPVVAGPAAYSDVPDWLMPIQIGSYSSTGHVDSLVSDIHSHLAGSAGKRAPRMAASVPGLSIWLRPQQWCSRAHEQFLKASREMGMSTRVIELPSANSTDAIDQETIDSCVGANYLFATLDGTFADNFVHYVCGAVLAKPRSGGEGSPARQVRLLVDPGQGRELIANSALNCQGISTIEADDVMREVRKFGHAYRVWANLGSG